MKYITLQVRFCIFTSTATMHAIWCGNLLYTFHQQARTDNRISATSIHGQYQVKLPENIIGLQDRPRKNVCNSSKTLLLPSQKMQQIKKCKKCKLEENNAIAPWIS